MNVSYQQTQERPITEVGAEPAPVAARVPAPDPVAAPWLPTPVLLLILASLAARLVMANAVDPGYDEAYYWSYARNLDWSYFDHPPMVGWLAAFGPALLGWVSAWTLRLGAVLLFTGSLVLMYRLTARLLGPRAGFWSVAFFNFVPIFCVGYGTFLAPDSGLVFFWLLTLVGLARACFPLPGEPDRPRVDLPAALAMGLGLGGSLLSKYHGVFLTAGAFLFLLSSRPTRRLLLRPPIYFSALLGVLCFLPVLYWNARNGYASFVFQGARALPEGSGYDWHKVLGALGGQMVELTPMVALVCWYFLARTLRRDRLRPGSPALFLAIFGLIPLVFFTALAGVGPTFAHWPMPAYLALIPLAGAAIAQGLDARPRLTRGLMIGTAALIVCSATVSYLHARFGILQRAAGARHVVYPLFEPRTDPSLEMTGWTQLGEFLRAKGYERRPNTFFFSHLYYLCGIVEFGLQHQGQVYCFNQGDARAFAFWQDPAVPLGQDGIYVVNQRFYLDAAREYAQYFERVEKLDEMPLYRNGVEVERFTLFIGHKLIKPFPYTYAQAQGKRSDPTGFRLFQRLPVYL